MMPNDILFITIKGHRQRRDQRNNKRKLCICCPVDIGIADFLGLEPLAREELVAES